MQVVIRFIDGHQSENGADRDKPDNREQSVDDAEYDQK